MKNRTIIGLVCIVLAIAVTFLVAPLVNRMTSDSTDVIRLSKNITRGTQITTEHLEVVSVKKDSIPIGVINDVNKILGKYAASNLYSGDYLTAAKLAGEAISADDAFASLDGKVAISVPISSFAGSLSGKLENGDIVRFYIRRGGTNETAYVPGALQWVKIVTTTTGSGVDQDKITENEDGSHDMPSTITILANEAQAKLLAQISGTSTIHLALVYRGDLKTAQTYLDMQDAYFEDLNNAGLNDAA